MTDSKPSVGTWVSRGILTGLVLLIMYLAALGPLVWLANHGPAAWRDATVTVIIAAYWPVLYGLEQDLLPESVTWPYSYWLDWWQDL